MLDQIEAVNEPIILSSKQHWLLVFNSVLITTKMFEVEVALDSQNDTFGLHDWYAGSRQLSSECDVDT